MSSVHQDTTKTPIETPRTAFLALRTGLEANADRWDWS